MPGNDSSACTSGLVVHAVPRRLRASLARIHSQPVHRALRAERASVDDVARSHRAQDRALPSHLSVITFVDTLGSWFES